MPELPEVEVVRAGLAPAVSGARVVALEVRDPRALKRHEPLGGAAFPGGHARMHQGREASGCVRGAATAAAQRAKRRVVTLSAEAGRERAADFERRLTGAVLGAPVRRGKFMWIPFAGHAHASPVALLAHLGMSGQMLLRELDAPEDRHVRVRLWIDHPVHGELRLDFADQRLFGSLAIDGLTPTDDGAPAGWTGPSLLSAATARVPASELPGEPAASLIPAQAAHIARDPLDPAFDDDRFVRGLRARAVPVKSVLLDQGLVSGIGNIYADEALWRARLHPALPGLRVGPRKARELLARVRDVFAQALAEGGTSFDAQYVNVNGQAGYFAHSLNAYGRTGEPCARCGAPLRRLVIGGRASHFCPVCQRRR